MPRSDPKSSSKLTKTLGTALAQAARDDARKKARSKAKIARSAAALEKLFAKGSKFGKIVAKASKEIASRRKGYKKGDIWKGTKHYKARSKSTTMTKKKTTTYKRRRYSRYPFSAAGARGIRRQVGGPFGGVMSLSKGAGSIRNNTYGFSYKGATDAQREARKRDHFYGRGLYMRGQGGFWGNLWNQRSRIFDAGNAAATAMGYGAISAPIRQALKASGIGAYDVATNDLVNGGQTNNFQAPTFAPASDTGTILMTNREYIANVYGPDTSGFSVQSYELNPGLEATFPFLAQIAANYSEYAFLQLMFSYKSSVSEFQTTTGVAGQVLTATQYNTDEAPFSDKQSMMVYHGAASSKSTGNIIAGVECAANKLAGSHGKYVRHQGLPRGEDQKEYDLGRFSIATVDFPQVLQNQAIGELWVSYTVALRRPKLTVSRGLAISQDLFGCSPVTGGKDCPSSRLLADQVVATSGTTNVVIPWTTDTAEKIAASGSNIGCQISVPDKVVIAANLVVPFVPASATDPDQGQTVNGVLYSDYYPNLAGVGNKQGYAAPWPYVLAPATSGCRELKILFPADYSGDITIIFRAMSRCQDYDANWISTAARSEGNVKPINDMLMGFGQGTIAQPSEYFSRSDIDQSTCLVASGGAIDAIDSSGAEIRKFTNFAELHVRVQQSTNGVDNAVYLQIYNVTPNATSVAASIVNAQLQISEYNAGMTRKLTGLVDWQIPSTQDGRALPIPTNPNGTVI